MDYWDRISRIQQAQATKGFKKYGVTLEDNVELTTHDRLRHLQEELIDALMYIEHLKEAQGPEAELKEAYISGYRTGYESASKRLSNPFKEEDE